MANMKMNGKELGTIIDVESLPTSDINQHAFYRLNKELYVYEPIFGTWTKFALDLMVGSTETTDGVSGAVPGPTKTNGGSKNMILSDGTWGDLNYFGGVYDDDIGETDYIRRLSEPVISIFKGRKIDPDTTTIMTANFQCRKLFAVDDLYECTAFLITSPGETTNNIELNLMVYMYGYRGTAYFGSATRSNVYTPSEGLELTDLYYLCVDVYENNHKIGTDSSYYDPDFVREMLGEKQSRSYDKNNNAYLMNTQYKDSLTINGITYPMALVKTRFTVSYESVCPRAIFIQDVTVGYTDDSSITLHRARKFRRYGYCYYMDCETFNQYCHNVSWGSWKQLGAVENSIMMVSLDKYNALVASGGIDPRVIYVIKDE